MNVSNQHEKNVQIRDFLTS